MSSTRSVHCFMLRRQGAVSRRIWGEHRCQNRDVTTITSSAGVNSIPIGEKHLTPEEKSFMAETKVLHGQGKVLSTDEKSLLDTVNSNTLVIKDRARSVGRLSPS